MASDREKAEEAVVKRDAEDPELEHALSNATQLKVALQKEVNRHAEAMNRQNLGLIGKLTGDGQSLPTFAALLTVLATLVLAVGLFVAAYQVRAQAELWGGWAERSLSVTLAALAYVLGAGGKVIMVGF